ncbi:hypothetical protein HPB52_023258 [Rhipicephalus sanguineus]|uniref:Uncharacterized protein n=1 Tax=Rhipicephalus sanguineus TaxID=34632 RepID=A0A9D4Q0N9_RHISA|nr:hypothetical protein HPB52_023258 [Rhipicephalus sanguineus]
MKHQTGRAILVKFGLTIISEKNNVQQLPKAMRETITVPHLPRNGHPIHTQRRRLARARALAADAARFPDQAAFGVIDKTTLRILGGSNITGHFIVWLPKHMGSLVGGLRNLKETAHEAARGLIDHVTPVAPATPHIEYRDQ